MSVSTTTSFDQPTRYAKAYFNVFVVSIVLLWLPNKTLAYLVPFISIVWFILRSNSGRALHRLTTAAALFLLITVAYYFLYVLLGGRFILQNAFLFLFTYGSFLFFLVIPPYVILHSVPLNQYIRVIGIFIVVESLLGIFQVLVYVLMNGGTFDAAAGDIAQGTLDPLSFINQSGNLNNQIYSINLLALLLFYMPYAVSHRRGIWICAIGFVAILFASVWHVFICFLVAVVVVSIIFTRTFIRLSATRVLIALFLFFVISATALLQPRNFALIDFYFNKLTTFESLKTTVTKESLTQLPNEYPWVYVTGLGPGQYSSRAGLIGTGKYFGDFSNPTEVPLITPQVSEPFEKYIYPKWEEFALNPAVYGNSTMSRPFYSILSILIELGYVVFSLLLLWIALVIYRIKKAYNFAVHTNRRLTSLFALACAILVIFLIAISFFENYLEVAHAIFLGLLLFRYFYSIIRAKADDQYSINNR